MLDRLLSVFVAVSLALLIWLYARSRDQETLDSVPVPVDVVLGTTQAEQYSLEIVGPAQVLATFSGTPTRIREVRSLLQRDQLRIELNYTVPVDRMKENRVTESLLIEPSELNLPPGVTAGLLAGRNQVRLVLYKLGDRQLPVRVDHSLETESSAYQVEPALVRVRGPLEVLERMRAIPTQPALLPDPGSRKAASVALVRDLEGRPIQCDPPCVTVRAAASRKNYELTDVPIQFLTPAGFPYQPRITGNQACQVTLHVVGPVQDEPPHPFVFLDLTGKAYRDLIGQKPARNLAFEEPLQFHLPRGFQLEDAPSRPIAFELVPNANSSADH